MCTRPFFIALPLVLLAGCSSHHAALSGPWESPLLRDHPLAGRIWDVDAQRFISMDALEARVRSAEFVLLGETHDNPDHHLLQARLLKSASQGRAPSVAFEMFDVPQQQQLDAAVAANPGNPDALAEAMDWAHSGWPPFSIYRPIFEVALQRHLPLVAANLSRAQARTLIKEGTGALDAELQRRLAREEPEALLRAERDEMRTSHCGALPEDLIDPMVLAQRARNAQLAERMEQSDRGQGVVLITGGGHARKDRGVPRLLEEDRPGAKLLSVGFIEVQPGATVPNDYARELGAERLPFDVVIFTPAAEREDPCKAFHSGA